MNDKIPFPDRLTILHADTPVKTVGSDLPLSSPALSVRLTSLSRYSGFRVAAAIWSRSGRTDAECREDFFRTARSFRSQCDGAGIPSSYVLLTVEDLRLIGNDLAVLDGLKAFGVVSVIPFWRGENALGGGWDTDVGLSPFGREAIARCFALGLIPDISHASRRSSDEILSMGEAHGLPVIASHVGFDYLFPHGRNLTDRDARRIAALGGLVGVTFHAPHLNRSGVGIPDVVSHLSHGLSVCPDAISLGTDFDGTDELPDGLSSTDDLPALADALSSAGLTPTAVAAIFSRNADRFFGRIGLCI
ncbi:MAG: membrane dipeptidase [Clostridia bacterium]|nr:membrane dipeptidase [Clostridia bacterium]MBR5043778.1 membrane dipeptidase [Clostridia bacterium]